MTTRTTLTTAIAAGLGVIALYGAATAQTTGTARTPTQADFDLCNREAQAGGGSASPGAAGSAGTSTSAAGATGSTGTVSGSTPSAGGTGASAGATGTAGTGAGATATGSVGTGATASGDAQVSGMAAAGQNDAAYQQAYRDCMRRQGY